jgi:prepilin-type N-terminal cleavage/methylation domain-containing protein
MRINHRKQVQGFAIRNPRSALRDGLTLAEVLIALLVLAIGLMGVLSLYPLGARQMALAVKDERCSQLADNVEGLFRIYWRSACLASDGQPRTDLGVYQTAPELQQLDTTSANTAVDPNLVNDPFLKSPGPSKVMFLDPIGWGAGGGLWVGGVNGLLPRRSSNSIEAQPTGVNKTALRLRGYALLDDMSFNQNGVANPVVRGYRYNAGVILQRAKNSARNEVNVKVVVYQSRPATDIAPVETWAGTTNLTPGNETLPTVAGLGNLRQGSWILMTSQGGANVQPFADFYRVVGVVQNGATTTSISISPPIRARHKDAGTAYQANMFLLDGVAEVFDRGTITPFEVPAS